MDDCKMWKVWFFIAFIAALLVIVLPLIGIPVD